MKQPTFLNEIRNAQIEAIDLALGDSTAVTDISKAIQNIKDLSECIETITSRPDQYIFSLALRELQNSLMSAICAHYRQSLSSQRLSLELWFAGIYFSTNEYNYLKWKMNEKDIVWSQITNNDDGIFSQGFAHVFWPASEKKIGIYRDIAQTIYRECCEFVHGNNDTHNILPKTFHYSHDSLSKWCKNIDTITPLFLYTFLVRFNKSLTPNNYEKISPILLENIGHIAEVRELISNHGR